MINNNNRSPIYTKLFLGLIFLRLLKESSVLLPDSSVVSMKLLDFDYYN